MANNSDKQERGLLIGSCMEINAGNPFSQLRDLFHLKTYSIVMESTVILSLGKA